MIKVNVHIIDDDHSLLIVTNQLSVVSGKPNFTFSYLCVL